MYSFDINLIRRATTQYTNYDFNSMVRFGDQYIGASSSMLAELSGSDDDGTDIDCYFEIVSDFGIHNPKQLRFMHLGYESDGNLLVTLSGDEKAERPYTVTSSQSGQQRARITVKENQYGRYWTCRISNVDGSDMGIDSIITSLYVRSHGIV